jgi:caspase 7
MLSNLVNKISSNSSTSISASESSNSGALKSARLSNLKNEKRSEPTSSATASTSSSATCSPIINSKNNRSRKYVSNSASNTPNSKATKTKNEKTPKSAKKFKNSPKKLNSKPPRAKSSSVFSNLNSLFHEKLKLGSGCKKENSESCDINNSIELDKNATTAKNKLIIDEENKKERVIIAPTLQPSTLTAIKQLPLIVEARFADEPEYRMSYARRGYAVIINNKRFDDMPLRDGTDFDAAKLESCLKRLEFDVKLFHNQPASSMLSLLNYYARLDHSDSDCFMCVLLSHGDNDIVYGVDKEVEIERLIEPFKFNRTLAGKPKIFMIQACRGTKLMDGIDTNPFQVNYVSKIPIEADFLITYSTIAGYFSWRNSQNGTWFIQSLCSILNEHGKNLEIMQILTLVNRRVAFYYESNASDPSMSHKRQIPCIVSMLTKELYLRPKNKIF